MSKKIIIQRFLAAFMLVVFAFSIAPRKYVHDVFADHKDSFFSSSGDGNLILHKAAINCHTESIVATSPFTDDAVYIHISTPVVFSEKLADHITSHTCSAVLFASLRGPPSLI